MNEYHPHRCPVCGSPIDFEPDCPGYGSPGKIMVCYPYCGNAIRYSCMDKACSWWYRDPNNRSAEGMGIAPSWLKEIHASLESESIVGEPEEKETVPTHICDINKNPLIQYVAYNGRYLTGLIIGYDPRTSEADVDIVIFTNMSNVNGVKNFGMQFHADVPYNNPDQVTSPVLGTWHWYEQS